MIQSKFLTQVFAGVLTLASLSMPCIAQDSSKLSTSYIPPDALVAAFGSPSEILQGEQMELLPVEVFQAAIVKQVGIDPITIESVKVIAAMPSPAGPVGGVVVETNKDFSLADVVSHFQVPFDSVTVDGLEMYQTQNNRVTFQCHQPDSKTLLIGTAGYVSAMMKSKSGSEGTLAKLAGRVSKRPGLMLITVLEPIRPIVTPMLRQQVQMLPPNLQSVADLPEQTDALLVNVNYSFPMMEVGITFVGRDEAAAQSIATTLTQCIDTTRDMLVSSVGAQVRGDDPVQLSTVQYLRRIGDYFSERLKPQVDGKIVQIKDEGTITSIGFAAGLLLPAVQAARDAARRMTVSNEMKQIGLAIHNYHSAYRKLPFNTINDASGEPLLSWRVAILPFLEEMELYQQFRLDERWDSPHNQRLLEQMPAVFANARMGLAPGETVFLAPAGEGMMAETGKELRFRDVLDGLSNTLMVVEANQNESVPWTKPSDLTFDSPDLKSSLPIRSPDRGSWGLFGDGAVIQIDPSLSAEMLRAMLTRAGGETVSR
ncbi:DUF1559 domain-containing protein [Rhodopirellula sp. MGV]|uniref:DUF1559 domain-containing protein n=1 Tax=Rhodopirellula sp. MGV TaxID=2023130 RepID=UPI0013041FB3|nr:DUF1559 domain-containing protein [Rhodopirellula sp. MGV]